MRGKIAKQLRAAARVMSVGMPLRQILAVDVVKKVKVTNPKHPKFGQTIDVRMQLAVNDPNSFRGVYRTLKKAYRKGELWQNG